MSDPRASYLEALGIRRWVRRAPPAPGSPSSSPGAAAPSSTDSSPAGEASPAWHLGEAAGRCLLLCDNEAEARTALAGDLARSLRNGAAWGWPTPGAGGPPFPEGLEQSAPAAVIVFGEALARSAFAGRTPESPGGMPVFVAPALAELRGSPVRRRECWQLLQKLARARSHDGSPDASREGGADS